MSRKNKYRKNEILEEKSLWEDADVIYEYTSKQAEEDGILVDITKLNPDWKKGLFNYVTSNLLSKGYLKNDKVNIPCILDLFNQANVIVRILSRDFKRFDSFFSGIIELPSGENQKIFIEMNEAGYFTIMLPEDR